jgi:hypothetical protein
MQERSNARFDLARFRNSLIRSQRLGGLDMFAPASSVLTSPCQLRRITLIRASLPNIRATAIYADSTSFTTAIRLVCVCAFFVGPSELDAFGRPTTRCTDPREDYAPNAPLSTHAARYDKLPAMPRVTLTVDQIEIAAQFADHSFDYPRLSFDQVAKKVLGSKPFPNTPNGRKFRIEAKAVFDQERKN